MEKKLSGKIISYYLHRAGITQVTAAQALGVSPVAINNWLSGKYAPSEKHLDKLSELLNVNKAVIKGEAPLEFPETYEEFRLLAKYFGLTFTDVLKEIAAS